jgi:sulfur carrier protein
MNVIINGEKKNVEVTNVLELVHDLKLNPGLIVIEVEGEILDRSNWEAVEMKEDLTIEIVHFVGGG